MENLETQDAYKYLNNCPVLEKKIDVYSRCFRYIGKTKYCAVHGDVTREIGILSNSGELVKEDNREK